MKAFPQKYPIDPSRPWLAKENPVDTGMDLRDYFAAKAMQAIITNEKTENMHPDAHSVAQDAYVLANAMMEARK
jgi:hypothetical protein